MLALYPDALIVEVEFYGATWEVRTTLYEIEISSSTGEVLRIERDLDDDLGQDDDLPLNVAFSMSQALAAARAFYPNTQVIEVSWDDDGYWEVALSNNLELRFSGTDGAYLGAVDLLLRGDDLMDDDDRGSSNSSNNSSSNDSSNSSNNNSNDDDDDDDDDNDDDDD